MVGDKSTIIDSWSIGPFCLTDSGCLKQPLPLHRKIVDFHQPYIFKIPRYFWTIIEQCVGKALLNLACFSGVMCIYLYKYICIHISLDLEVYSTYNDVKISFSILYIHIFCEGGYIYLFAFKLLYSQHLPCPLEVPSSGRSSRPQSRENWKPLGCEVIRMEGWFVKWLWWLCCKPTLNPAFGYVASFYIIFYMV